MDYHSFQVKKQKTPQILKNTLKLYKPQKQNMPCDLHWNRAVLWNVWLTLSSSYLFHLLVSDDCMCFLKLFAHLDDSILYVVTVDSEPYYVVLHIHKLKATCNVMHCVLPMWYRASDLFVNDESNWLGSEESVSGEPIFKLGGFRLLCQWVSCVLEESAAVQCYWPSEFSQKETNKQKGHGGGRKKSMKRPVIIIYMEPVLCCLLFILRNWWFRRRNTPRRMLYESL